MIKNFYLFPVLLVILVCSGCSGENRPEGLPALYPVTLTILLDDKPIEGALVFLHSEDPAIKKWTVGSYTNAEGKAIVMTHGQFQGAPAGKFKVCVSKQEVPGGPPPGEGGNSIGSTVVETGFQPPVHHVAPVFGKRETTPLEIEVLPNRKMLELTLEVHGPR